MNIFTQIGIGLIPAVIAWIIVMIARKCYSVKTIAVALCSLAICCTLLFGGKTDTVTDKVKNMKQDDIVDLAYALLATDSDEALEDIVNEYSATFGYDEECTLLLARNAAINGDAKKAKTLYRKLISLNPENEKTLADEIALANAASESYATDPYTLNYIKQAGYTPEELGLSDSYNPNAVEDMISNAKNIVANTMNNRKINDTVKNLAALLNDTLTLYNGYIENGTPYTLQETKTQAEALVEQYSALSKDYSEAFTLYPIRIARLKACVLSEDYSAIAKNMDDFSSYDELMIASELYMNHYVSAEDFDSSWRKNESKKLEKIYTQLEKNLDNSDADDETYNRTRKRIDMLMSTSSGNVLNVIQERLNPSLEDSAVYVDKSKIYLQKSKISRYLGDEESSSESMLTAIDTAANSSDDDYAYPMGQISGIINGTSDASNVLNIATYVDQVVDNSLTVQPTTDIFIERTTTEDGTPIEQKHEQNFSQYMEEQVISHGAKLNIGSIDWSNFPNITARVQISEDLISSESNPSASITVTDCYQDIESFSLSKLEYSASNILLLCDNSGSMSSSVSELKNAVTNFIDSSSDDENIALVTFDSSILKETSFNASDSELQSVIDGMGSYGGTNIYNSLQYSIEKFVHDPKANNVIIVMTDGQDGHSNVPYETIYAEIGLPAENKNITIYTLGLGGVDAEYLTFLATAGGGDFLYASDHDKLNAFYDLIHNQAKNQYLLEYKAKDTLTVNNRELLIKAKKNDISNSKYYSLSTGDANGENKIKINENLHLYGFDTKIIYKSNSDTTVLFKGSGFKEDDALSLTLDGTLDYKLSVTYVDENTYSVVIPHRAVVDTYSLRINIGPDSAVIPNELHIVNKNQKSITFGGYTFTANKIITESSNSTLLTGMVTLNGWLHFRGDVRLVGDVKNGSSISIQESNGSNIYFSKESAVGLAKSMATKGIPFGITPFYNLTIYNDPDHLLNPEEYRVHPYSDVVLKSLNLMLTDVDLLLYPDRFVVDGALLTPSLPFQEQIVKGTSFENIFSVDFDMAFPVNQNGIYINIDTKYENNDHFKGVKLCNTYVQLDKASFKWDALKDEIKFTFMVKFNFTKEAAIGLTLGWKNGYCDEVRLHVDTDVNLNVSGVPVTLSDFSGGLTDMSKMGDKLTKERLWNSSLVLGTKLSVAKLSSYFKPLAKYLGDICVVSTDDFELKFSLGQGSFSAKTDILLLGEIKTHEVELEIGNISYTNSMLGLQDVDATGFRSSLKQGIMYDKLEGFKINATVDGELNIHSKFFGAVCGAEGSLDISWWVFEKSYDVYGDLLFGIYNDHYDRTQFVVGYRNSDGKKVNGKTVYVSSGGIDVKDL